MKNVLTAGLGLVLLISCNDNDVITDAKDYNPFMREGIIDKEVMKIQREVLFWEQRLGKDTGNNINLLELANCHLRLFKSTGEVMSLSLADSLLKRSSALLRNTDPDILYALSQTAITQHQFQNAANYNQEGEKMNGSKYKSHILAFDAGMELGQYHSATQKLEKLRDRNSFDFLIRESKLEDHKGNLDKAIHIMEYAFDIVKEKNQSLYCWTLSNLADMYGHAGRIEDAYKAYLNVLSRDSSYLYALKGIAWIAFSNDRSIAEAKRIYKYLLSQTKMPDILLRLAEMEEWEGNAEAAKAYTLEFIKEVSQPLYGDMYYKYLIEIYAEKIIDLDRALVLAQKEVSSRPTPETFDWLAWVHYKRGELEQAYGLTMSYVYKQTHEPVANYHTALIFAANGKREIAKKLLKECLQSSFEVGPFLVKEIKTQLHLMH